MSSSSSSIPKLSSTFLNWIRDTGEASVAQQQRTFQSHSYKSDTTQNRMLVDIVVTQVVVEDNQHPFFKRKYVNNIIMAARLIPDALSVINELSTQLDLTNGLDKIDLKIIPTERYARYHWLKIVKERCPERLNMREYGHLMRNAEVKSKNLVEKSPDNHDHYNHSQNQPLVDEYGSIYIYNDDFVPSCSYDEIVQHEKEAAEVLYRQELKRQMEWDKRRKERQEAEEKQRQQMYQEAAERNRNLKGPKDILHGEFDDVF